MSSNMNKNLFILLSISILYSSEINFLADYNSTLIPEINIENNEMKYEYKKGFSFYLKFSNKQNIQWNAEQLNSIYLEDAFFAGNRSFNDNTTIIKKEFLAGSISDLIFNEFIILDNSNIIEIPINKSFNKEDNLVLIDLPIFIKTLVPFLSEIEIMYNQSYINRDYDNYDWKKIDDAVNKIEEEVSELRCEVESGLGDNKLKAEIELGDLLFTIVNLARKLQIEPEGALRKATEKFINRFEKMEKNFNRRGCSLPDVSLKAMDEEWDLIKNQEQEA